MNFSAFGSFPAIHHQFSTAVTSSTPSSQVHSIAFSSFHVCNFCRRFRKTVIQLIRRQLHLQLHPWNSALKTWQTLKINTSLIIQRLHQHTFSTTTRLQTSSNRKTPKSVTFRRLQRHRQSQRHPNFRKTSRACFLKNKATLTQPNAFFSHRQSPII